MDPSLLSRPRASASQIARKAYDQPDWLLELLACTCPGRDRLLSVADRLECAGCGSSYPVRDGIPDLVRPEWRALCAEQQDSWRRLEQARGQYDTPFEQIVHLPQEPLTRSLLDWLRALLRSRGPCRVLELGAGRGWATRALAEDDHQAVASDVLDDPHIALGCALRQRANGGWTFGCVRARAEALPFQPESFDCVFCFATLRHLVDLERVLQEASRVLRPGGLFIALREPFRGLLTTPMQWLQDSVAYRQARGWIVGKLPDGAAPEVLELRDRFGSSLHDICRRVPFYQARARAAGLQATVLPTPVVLSLPPSENGLIGPSSQPAPEWLDSLASAYELDPARLRSQVESAGGTDESGLVHELIAHWSLIGNMEGVLLAVKGDPQIGQVPTRLITELAQLRRLDPLLLACAPQHLVPIYGLYAAEGGPHDRYHWIQPQAGFLIAGGDSVELTVTCPGRHFRPEPTRIELRFEEEPTPLLIVLVRPGKTVTLKVPIPQPAAQQPSLLLRLTVNLAFLPSDHGPGQADTRLLALQLRGVRAVSSRQ